jgi:glycosyltransferase involved in cell wall biosynthesis
MRVCHLCSAHPVDDPRVFHRMCVSLSAAGYEVHLLAASERSEPYRLRGVTVHPLPICPSRRRRFARRFRVAQMAADLKPDLFHVHEPELLGSMIACAGSRPVVYDVHESYLDILTEREWIPPRVKPFARFVWDRWERHLLQRCAAIVAATDHIAERYLRLHPRVVSIRNFTDVSIEAAESTLADRDGRTCVFAGTILPGANMGNTIRALGILHRRGIKARLWLAGRISDSYKHEVLALASREGLSKQVQHFGILSRADALALQASASIGLVNILATPNGVNSLPTKMLECMALRLPLVYSNFPAFEKIAGSCGAGIAVDPTKPEQTANAIECLITDPKVAWQMGQAGMNAAREQFHWNIEHVRLLDLYQNILGIQEQKYN